MVKKYTKNDMLSFGRFCARAGVEAGLRGLGCSISDSAVSKWKKRVGRQARIKIRYL
jgi:hypothetical protein